MNWGDELVADAFRAFKAKMELYLEDQNVNDRHKQATLWQADRAIHAKIVTR